MLNRKFKNVQVDGKLKMGKGSSFVATNSAGAETIVDMTELAIVGGLTATSTQINVAADAANAHRTATGAGSIDATDHGKLIFLNNATGFATTLPAPIAGFRVTVISKTSNTSGNHTVVTASSANVIKGFAANAAGALVTPLSAGDTISFVANQSVAGDQVSLTSDGTSWFMTGFAQVAAGVTITQAS